MLIEEVVPRFYGGLWPHIALCHRCQRKAYFAGSFIKLLAKGLEHYGTGHYMAIDPDPKHAARFGRLAADIKGNPHGK